MRVHTVWPSLERSTEGWFGGRTSFVVPITGHDILKDRAMLRLLLLRVDSFSGSGWFGKEKER